MQKPPPTFSLKGSFLYQNVSLSPLWDFGARIQICDSGYFFFFTPESNATTFFFFVSTFLHIECKKKNYFGFLPSVSHELILCKKKTEHVQSKFFTRCFKRGRGGHHFPTLQHFTITDIHDDVFFSPLKMTLVEFFEIHFVCVDIENNILFSRKDFLWERRVCVIHEMKWLSFIYWAKVMVFNLNSIF
jgi:hypothetical protein